MTYYNENDPYCAAWLQNLAAAGHIAAGVVDDRSIRDLEPDAARGFTRAHFFAGIGGWDLALQLAGWPDEREVWTGSCPCQPFSVAGKRKGNLDDRHLWPCFERLIAQSRPPVVFGEQVSSADGRLWLAGVQADVEALGYGFWAVDSCAAGVSAPHVRQRLFWVAFTAGGPVGHGGQSRVLPGGGADAGMVDAYGHHSHWWDGPLQVGRNAIAGEVTRSGRQYHAQWRIKPGLSIVALGIPRRLEQCRAYGNAIVPQLAAEFIQAFLDAEEDQ